MHDQVGGFWIDVNVELGRWGGVAAFEQATAHEHDFAQARADFGRLTQGLPEIGQRPEGAEGQGAGRAVHDRLNDEIDGVAFSQRHGGLGQVVAIETGLAVDVFRRDQFTLQRGACAGEDRDVGAARQLAHDPRIAAGQGQWNVTGNAGDAAHFKLG